MRFFRISEQDQSQFSSHIFVFLFTDVILTVQSATRFFRASSEADCVTFVAGLTPTKDDDAASVDFGR